MSKGRPSTIPFSGDIASVAPPRRPTWLDKMAKKKWDELMASEDGSTFSTADETLLSTLCDAFSDWRRLSAEVAKMGGEVLGKIGKQHYNLVAAARDRAEKRMRSAAKQLNLGNRSKRRGAAQQRVPTRDRSKGPPPPQSGMV